MLLISIALGWLVLAGLALVLCLSMLRAGHQEDVHRRYVED